MATQSIRIGGGMTLQSRLLWHFGWNQRPLYILAAILGLLGAIKFGSIYGLLFGLLPLGICILAIKEIKTAFPTILANAKIAVARSGAERVGIPFESSDCAVFAVSTAPSQMLLPPPSHTFSCVYISDAFLAVFAGSSFDLARRAVQLSTTAEEIYFRHVSSINQQDGFIEINQTRAKPKRIAVGNDPSVPRLLEALRTRLRSPRSSPTPTPDRSIDANATRRDTPLTIGNSDDERYCYIRSSKLTEHYADPVVLDVLLQQLQVPGTTAIHKQMADQEKRAAIESWIENFRRTPNSFWFDVPLYEVIAASIWRAQDSPFISNRIIKDKFYSVAREEDLMRPVARWLAARTEEPYMEVQLGRRRIDVLGHKNGRLTAVELKNSDEEFRRGPDQMNSFAEYAHTVYLACTPAFAADYLERNADHRDVNRWDPTLLDRKLKQGGFGLLIVERDNVFEVIKPVEQNPSPERVSRVVSKLTSIQMVELD
jgi:hypothetical protein